MARVYVGLGSVVCGLFSWESLQDRQEDIETGLEHLSDRDTYNELEEDQTKEIAEEVTQAVRSMYQEGHIDKPTAEYLLPPRMVRTTCRKCTS